MSIDVSVVTPTFRRPRQLVEAVKSALSQEGVQVDVLVLDDSPEGSAREAIEQLGDPRVKYVLRSIPSGGSPALVRNEGWPQAKGRYVHFLDDDDRVAPGAYRAMVGALDHQPNKGVAFGRIVPFGDDGTVLEHEQSFFLDAARRARFSQQVGSRRLMVLNMLFKPTVLVNSSCMIRRECIASLGGYNPRCAPVEDVDFYIRAIRRFGCVFLDRVVLHYRTGAPSIMHDRKSDDVVVEAYKEIYAKYKEDYGAVELMALKLAARTVLRWL